MTTLTVFERAPSQCSAISRLPVLEIGSNSLKRMSSVQFSRDLNVQYKTAFVLSHKLREALAAETATETLSGEVAIDGAYFGGHVRPENRKEDRLDRREKANQSDRRRVVIALRERGGRTLSFVRNREAEGVEIARARMVANAKLYADEASHWDVLEMDYASTRINHSVSYSDGHGKHTNMFESYFSRLRRMVGVQHHHVSYRYLYQYANHAAWLEDHRRRSNGGNASALLGGALAHGVSRVWAGYRRRKD